MAPITQTGQTRTWEVPLAEILATLGLGIPPGEQSYQLVSRAAGLVLVLTVDEPVA